MPIQIYLDGVNLITSCFASVKVGVQVRGKKSSRSTYQRRHTANYHSTTTLPDHTTLEEGRPPATFSVPWELLTPALFPPSLSLTCILQAIYIFSYTMVRSKVCNSRCFCLGSYIQHQHFMTFDTSWHLTFHEIWHFMTFDILSFEIACHLMFHVI